MAEIPTKIPVSVDKRISPAKEGHNDEILKYHWTEQESKSCLATCFALLLKDFILKK